MISRQDCHEKLVEVVGNTTGQLPDSFHLLCLKQLQLRLFERLLSLPFLGDVSSDLGEAYQLAVIEVDGVDDDICPEPRAVLAKSPPLLLEAAFPGGDLKRFSRQVLRLVESAAGNTSQVTGTSLRH